MKEIAAALARVQAEIGSASASSLNPDFESKYANLSEVWAVWQRVGPKNGLSLTQTVKILDRGQQALVTTLLHTSRENIISEMLLTTRRNDMQGIGSAITYARRYSMAAMVGIVQDDDDASAAVAGGASTLQASDSQKAMHAREAFARIKTAINFAKAPSDIDAVIASHNLILAEIKTVSASGYEQLMAFANERKENCRRMSA